MAVSAIEGRCHEDNPEDGEHPERKPEPVEENAKDNSYEHEEHRGGGRFRNRSQCLGNDIGENGHHQHQRGPGEYQKEEFSPGADLPSMISPLDPPTRPPKPPWR